MEERPATHRKPLTRCWSCSSPLIYPTAVQHSACDQVVVTRRCPECEERDVVICDADAAAAWLAREARLRAQLVAALAR